VDRLRKAKANMRDRYIAAAKEKDPFLRALKKPILSHNEYIYRDESNDDHHLSINLN
jgi:hypothetical protein